MLGKKKKKVNKKTRFDALVNGIVRQLLARGLSLYNDYLEPELEQVYQDIIKQGAKAPNKPVRFRYKEWHGELTYGLDYTSYPDIFLYLTFKDEAGNDLAWKSIRFDTEYGYVNEGVSAGFESYFEKKRGE